MCKLLGGTHPGAQLCSHPAAGVTKLRVLDGGVVPPPCLVPTTTTLYCSRGYKATTNALTLRLRAAASCTLLSTDKS